MRRSRDLGRRKRQCRRPSMMEMGASPETPIASSVEFDPHPATRRSPTRTRRRSRPGPRVNPVIEMVSQIRSAAQCEDRGDLPKQRGSRTVTGRRNGRVLAAKSRPTTRWKFVTTRPMVQQAAELALRQDLGRSGRPCEVSPTGAAWSALLCGGGNACRSVEGRTYNFTSLMAETKTTRAGPLAVSPAQGRGAICGGVWGSSAGPTTSVRLPASAFSPKTGFSSTWQPEANVSRGAFNSHSKPSRAARLGRTRIRKCGGAKDDTQCSEHDDGRSGEPVNRLDRLVCRPVKR